MKNFTGGTGSGGSSIQKGIDGGGKMIIGKIMSNKAHLYKGRKMYEREIRSR